MWRPIGWVSRVCVFEHLRLESLCWFEDGYMCYSWLIGSAGVRRLGFASSRSTATDIGLTNEKAWKHLNVAH